MLRGGGAEGCSPLLFRLQSPVDQGLTDRDLLPERSDRKAPPGHIPASNTIPGLKAIQDRRSTVQQSRYRFPEVIQMWWMNGECRKIRESWAAPMNRGQEGICNDEKLSAANRADSFFVRWHDIGIKTGLPR